MRGTSRRLAGIVGPALFVTAWAVLGARRDSYSPIDDPISRLAAVDAPTRVPMTLGFLAYAAGVGFFAPELRRIDPAVRWAAMASALGTIAIAATPLDSWVGDGPHAAAAAASYTALAALPLLAARPLAHAGRRRAAVASVATGIAVAGFLVASATAPGARGLWQRTGLTLGDAWIVAAAVVLTTTNAEARGRGEFP